ncbi:MAG: 50S ribosomal protein L15 [bacterium]|nr:50S ribosomal protein L15 [bacterium]
MKAILSNLSPPFTRKSRKRVGRGLGSGHGKTACRGTKGQLARSGSKRKPWFEGGQTPLIRRIPKRGFKNPCRTEYEIINVGEFNRFESGSVIDPAFLRKAGLVKSRLPIKILGDGELTKSFIVRAHKFSKSAKDKIESLKGKVEELPKSRSFKGWDK